MPWIDSIAGLVQAWYPGQEAGNAIADVLTGAAEPGGRLPQTFPVRWSDNPAFSQDPLVYPGQDGRVEYREGLLVGYRHYDKHGIDPLFPFGFGLSYTSFAYDNLTIDRSRIAAGAVTVGLDVCNTGDRAGSTVVQLYITPNNPPLQRPQKELKAFAKVALERAESRRVSFDLDARCFSYFDVDAQRWVAAPGDYILTLATDAITPIARERLILNERIEQHP